ncbi:Pentatricopeptide repeat [Parasponia andersonii]|uniref:Pentatricopeptide repeat n=1 Tax=Parasponia andersonii TaxID=3476 RepID=A0A2P5CAH2_PARAD|nr:Pentatricopeptide repeat [Parasponia andersonii]
MRLSWRLLLLGARVGPGARVSVHHSHSHPQVQSLPNIESIRSLTSLIHTHSLHGTLSPSKPIFGSHFVNPVNPKSPMCRSFSSEPQLELKDSDYAAVSEIFSETKNLEEIKKDLESRNIVISHELILWVLRKLESIPDVARRFFNWVLESEEKKLSSKSYNSMLRILGLNGFVNEFWGLVEVMKRKGYGISKGVRDKVLERFEEDGLGGDVERLKGVFSSGSVDHSEEKISLRIYRIVRNEVWGDNVEKQIKDLNATFSSKMVKVVLEKLSIEPMKALIFFRWLDESGLFKHDQQTYNAMARVLGRKDCIDRFWKVLDEMRSFQLDLEMKTFVIVLGRFCKRKMNEEAVNLYEYVMAGSNKPPMRCETFLLRKIVTGKKLDMSLFSRVVKAFTNSGCVLTDSIFDLVLKSLTSVGRIGECTKVLKAMEEGGYVASGNMRSKIVFQLNCAGKKNEANAFLDSMEESGYNPDWKTWRTLIQGFCAVGDLDKGSGCLRKMVEVEDARSVSSTVDLIVVAYCERKKAKDAYTLLNDLISENKVKPWLTTYETLVTKLLAQGGFSDALNILELMRNNGTPPVVDPIIKYVSKSGTGDDAIAFLKATTSKKFPPTSVVLRVLEAYFMAGRCNEAHNFLSKCPRFIRNHPDVLNLFLSMKSGKGAPATPVAA